MSKTVTINLKELGTHSQAVAPCLICGYLIPVYYHGRSFDQIICEECRYRIKRLLYLEEEKDG